MTISKLYKEIEDEVEDILSSDFELKTSNARGIPTYDDPDLTFERGLAKRGKKITTCVLYIDIRNSVALNKQHPPKTMAQLYSAFTKATTDTAHHFSGAVRNIIGDRVMVVFEPDNCFKNAVSCAKCLNYICEKIINKHFELGSFKCGIGIDYGEMTVIKVGAATRGRENSHSKNLIWVGNPANIASRLTDIANKEIDTSEVEYTYERKKPTLLKKKNQIPIDIENGEWIGSAVSSTSLIQVQATLSAKEFAKKVTMTADGKSTIKLSSLDFKLISFKHIQSKIHYEPILMTNAVFEGFKNSDDLQNLNFNNNPVEVKAKLKDYSGKIWGLTK